MYSNYFLWTAFFGYLLTICDCYLTEDEKDTFVPEQHPNWNNLDHRSCGFSFHERIIGGKSVRLGKYPWIVRLGKIRSSYLKGLINTNNPMVFPCAGVILNRFYVLSAGHCFLDTNSLPTTVRAGEYNTTSHIDCDDSFCAPPFQDIPILEYYTPRFFKPKSMENDIALVKLKWPIVFSETILPICMPPYLVSSRNLTNCKAEVAGWGLTDIYTKKTPSVLNAVTLKVVDNNWCRMYKKKHKSFAFNIICAGSEVGRDSCSGDSGGPLMLAHKHEDVNQYFVIGIVSYGPEACGETDSPGVYTYVPQFAHWILDLIKEA